MQRTRHLDLGCGPVPRNPYKQDELFGVDIAPTENSSQYRLGIYCEIGLSFNEFERLRVHCCL
jgi:hypothetical protein